MSRPTSEISPRRWVGNPRCHSTLASREHAAGRRKPCSGRYAVGRIGGRLRLLFISALPAKASKPYTIGWRPSMRVLLVSKLAQSSRAVSTIVKYAEAAGEMGHQVAVFGEKDSDFPGLEFSLDVTAFDVAIFVVYMPFDFPDLPYLATLLDGVPKERRIVIDCLGR